MWAERFARPCLAYLPLAARCRRHRRRNWAIATEPRRRCRRAAGFCRQRQNLGRSLISAARADCREDLPDSVGQITKSNLFQMRRFQLRDSRHRLENWKRAFGHPAIGRIWSKRYSRQRLEFHQIRQTASAKSEPDRGSVASRRWQIAQTPSAQLTFGRDRTLNQVRECKAVNTRGKPETLPSARCWKSVVTCPRALIQPLRRSCVKRSWGVLRGLRARASRASLAISSGVGEPLIM
jgi:hypothetical protein